MEETKGKEESFPSKDRGKPYDSSREGKGVRQKDQIGTGTHSGQVPRFKFQAKHLIYLCAKLNMNHMSNISCWQRKWRDVKQHGTIERMQWDMNTCYMWWLQHLETWRNNQLSKLLFQVELILPKNWYLGTFRHADSWDMKGKTQVTSMLGTFTHPYDFIWYPRLFRHTVEVGGHCREYSTQPFPICCCTLTILSMQVGGIHTGHF